MHWLPFHLTTRVFPSKESLHLDAHLSPNIKGILGGYLSNQACKTGVGRAIFLPYLLDVLIVEMLHDKELAFHSNRVPGEHLGYMYLYKTLLPL